MDADIILIIFSLTERIADLEQQLADVGSINLRLMEQLAEAKEENRKLRLYLKPHYTDGRIEEALNNDKDRVGYEGA